MATKDSQFVWKLSNIFHKVIYIIGVTIRVLLALPLVIIFLVMFLFNSSLTLTLLQTHNKSRGVTKWISIGMLAYINISLYILLIYLIFYQ
jgi:hypothetical protein